MRPLNYVQETRMIKNQFTHLHVHTAKGSILDGIIKVKDHNNRKGLVSRVKEMGQTAIGITDHGSMLSSIELYNECNDQGILPIIGTEFYIIDADTKDPEQLKKSKTFHITIVAKNTAGYKNLIKLNSYAAKHYHRKPKIDYKVLEEHKEGLICLSGCPSSQIWYSLLRGDVDTAHRITSLLKGIFGDDFYMELQENNLKLLDHTNEPIDQCDINIGLRGLGREYGCKCCPTSDAHYLYKSDSRAHEIALCIATKARLTDPTMSEAAELTDCKPEGKAIRKRMKFDDEEYFVRSREELADMFSDNELNVTLEIEEKCRENPVHINNPSKDKNDKYLMPIFPIEKGTNKEAFFNEQCRKGFKERYGEIEDHPKYWERLIHESKIIKDMGFMDYFLMTEDMLRWAKGVGIPIGPGRGSAAGSIICYCFEITDVCPMEYSLLFERFLNPARVSMPDIDIDLSSARRGEIFSYCERKYGKDKVARIGTYGLSKSKSIINDVFKTYQGIDGLYDEEENPCVHGSELSELVDSDAGFTETLLMLMEKDEFKRLTKHLLDEKSDSYNKVFSEMWDIMMILENNTRNIGRHAAGMIVSPIDITEHAPLMRVDTKKKDAEKKNIIEYISQYDMSAVDDLGFIKMDFLSLETLDLIQRAMLLVKEKRGIDIDLKKINKKDAMVFKFLNTKDAFEGLFQISNKGFAAMLKSMKAEKIDDLMAGMALFRPGALRSGATERYCKRSADRSEYTHPIKELQDVLKETHGELIYQESIMASCGILCGWDMAKCDVVRRVMGKKKIEAIAGLKIEFMEDAGKHSPHVSKHLLENVFSSIEASSKYSFNKSHSVAYGMISYQTLWLKAHFTVEFLCATLTSCGNHDKTILAIEDANKLNIKVIQPDINKSEYDFVPGDGNSILYGFKMIKGIGPKPIEEIIRAREDEGDFTSYIDFVKKVDVKVINKRILDALIGSGCFDSIDKADKKVLLASNFAWVSSYKYDKNNKILRKKTNGLVENKKKMIKQEGYTDKQKEAKGYIKDEHLVLNYNEEYTIEDFLNEAEPKKISPTSLHDAINKQIELMNHSFYKVDLIELDKENKPNFCKITSKNNIINRIVNYKLSFSNEESISKDKIIVKQINLYRKYPKSYFMDEVMTPQQAIRADISKMSIPVWGHDKEHRDGRSGMMLIFGILKSKKKAYTKRKFGFYNIIVTDGPATIETIMWSGATDKMVLNSKENDYVMIICTKKKGFHNQGESYMTHAIMKM